MQFEIDTFLAQHRNERRILPVLVKGEPADAVPPGLSSLRVAADLRADSVGESRRKLRTEKLRLLAPILGCTFADLRQRHLERMFRQARRTALIAFGVLGVVIGLGVTAAVQWKSAAGRLTQALSIFESIDGTLKQRMGGEYRGLSRAELEQLVPDDRDAALFMVIFAELGFITLADRGIAEARIFFDKGDEIMAKAQASAKERARMSASVAYNYETYATASLQLHARKMALSQSPVIQQQVAASPGTVAVLTTDKDYAKEAIAGYELALDRINEVIRIDPVTAKYKEFKADTEQRLTHARLFLLPERVRQLELEARAKMTAFDFAGALEAWDAMLQELRKAPDSAPVAVLRAQTMLGRAAALVMTQRLDEAKAQVREVERLIETREVIPTDALRVSIEKVRGALQELR